MVWRVTREDTVAQFGRPTGDSPPTCTFDALCKNSMLQDATHVIELENLDWIPAPRIVVRIR
jgi:hypothetical protein